MEDEAAEVSEMDQYMHHHLDGANVHGPALPVLLMRLVGRLAILHESGMHILLVRIVATRGTSFESTPGPRTLCTPDY